jgi:hypothetical protein
MSRITLFGKLTHSLLGVTALYGQFSGDSGRLHRSLRDHFVFMSASAGYPRFFKASSTPSMIMDFAPLVESDVPQRFVGGFWQIDARMLDVRARPAACGLRWGAFFASR